MTCHNDKYRRYLADFIWWVQMDNSAELLATLGARIRKVRKSHKVTQLGLAELAGVSERTLRDIEHGKGSVSLENLLKVLQVLGLTIQLAGAE